MGRKKVKQFSAPGLKTSSIRLENGGVEGHQEQGTVVREQREKILNEPSGDKRFEDKGEEGVHH